MPGPSVGGVSVVKGTNGKPAASEALVRTFRELTPLSGQLMIGYPIIATVDGPQPIDAVYISQEYGVVVFDLVEGPELGDFQDRQDDAANKLESRLRADRGLVRRRDLLVGLHTVTFAPGLRTAPPDEDYVVVDGADDLAAALQLVQSQSLSVELFERALSNLQSTASIRRGRSVRRQVETDSRAERLQKLEESVATLDRQQQSAVIETVNGVQRIRGLAGSGKTIVLALKAAYLHASHPTWDIAVTFNTRSLKEQFRRLITQFSIEASGEEPDWSKLSIMSAWGAAGGSRREGLYYRFCRTNDIPYMTFGEAKEAFGNARAFAGACEAALEQSPVSAAVFDAILVDEAQDFPKEFLRLCYEALGEPKRLVYAYDELQNLTGDSVESPTEIFGLDEGGRPRVVIGGADEAGARSDIILERCYRNSRPVLVTAHALGFGVYRTPDPQTGTGLVQMFDQPDLWADIGYVVREGELAPGRQVTLARTEESSPRFLEEHSPIDDLIQFLVFETKAAQAAWVATEIERNIREEGLRTDDIVVINPDPLTTRKNLGEIRSQLLDKNVNSHLAGVDTDQDVFFQPEEQSVTFTGIYRAKGNEAGMVYIPNAPECYSSDRAMARLRNRLFTAITRSKAWVRVTGVGPDMLKLQKEYEGVRAANFELHFQYPTPEQRDRLSIVHRDRSREEVARVKERDRTLKSLVDDLRQGKAFREDLDDKVLEQLAELLGHQRE